MWLWSNSSAFVSFDRKDFLHEASCFFHLESYNWGSLLNLLISKQMLNFCFIVLKGQVHAKKQCN